MQASTWQMFGRYLVLGTTSQRHCRGLAEIKFKILNFFLSGTPIVFEVQTGQPSFSLQFLQRSTGWQLDGEASEVRKATEPRTEDKVKRPMVCMTCLNTYQSILSNQGGARQTHEVICIESATVTYF